MMTLTEKVERFLREKRVVTLPQICSITSHAEVTVRQALARLDYVTSYNENSRFYALRSICRFNRYGIWKHQTAFFTQHGTLAELLSHLVDSSSSGYTSDELRKITDVGSLNGLLKRLAKSGDVVRLRKKREYFYFSGRSKRRRGAQVYKRLGSTKLLTCCDETQTTEELSKTIWVLLEIIRSRPKTTRQLQEKVQKAHPTVSADMVSDVCSRYGVDLKKKCNPYRLFDLAVKISRSLHERTDNEYVFHFQPDVTDCPICMRSLQYYKTTTARSIRTLRYGRFTIRETQLRCDEHRHDTEDNSPLIYGSSFLRTLVPAGATIGYDVIVKIGKGRFCKSRQVDEVVEKLAQQDIVLSSSSVTRWADFFLAAVECLHYTRIQKLRRLIKGNGGYLLHIDGTTETKSDTVFVCVDRISGAILLTEKISSENVDEVERSLRRLKRDLGVPLAVMKDMSDAFDRAIQKVFPNTISRVCQFHFLADIGRDLLGTLHVNVGKTMTRLKVNPDLRRMKRELERSLPLEKVQSASDLFEGASAIEQMATSVVRQHEGVLSLSLTNWILAYLSDTEGLGFPFDLRRLCYYSRLNRARLRLRRYSMRHPRILKTCPNLQRLNEILDRVTDASLCEQIRELRSIQRTFQKLRKVLRFEITEKAPLAATLSLGSAREVRAYNRGVLAYTKELLAKQKRACLTDVEEVILKHFKVYQFSLLIPAELVEVLQYLDRTNNFEESIFRDDKRRQRRQVGKKDISREFSFHGPYLPLMRNLTNENYVAAVIGRIEDLPIRLSELAPKDIEHYQQKLYQSRRGKFFDCLPKIRTIDLLPCR